MSKFEEGDLVYNKEYKNLNKAQKEAVDTTEGPVMVVAGPGTGKTQVLALRIANILKKTDIKGDGILCLTFTNAGVEAMKKRLAKYLGAESEKVYVSTFHSFGMEMIQKYYSLLKLKTLPILMDELDLVAFYDELLFMSEWEHLRPRSDTARYFNDLKPLISILKRERITPDKFLKELDKEIKNVKNDEENLSTRGESKGKLKQEALKRIEGLERSREVAEFFALYEKIKKERNIFDYDDVLENLVKIAEASPEFCADIQERFLYVLIDEHQDSSGVQNEFLKKIWGEVEKPNIFAVGDDRQLIYGFGGASIEYFKGFKDAFGKAKLITLVENYRSTSAILKTADALLQSSLSDEKLISHHKENHPIHLIECNENDEEIAVCGEDLKKKIQGDLDPNDAAILVPKNRQVRNAAIILQKMGLPIASGEHFNFFDSGAGNAFLRVLKIINNPADNVPLALSFFDDISGVDSLSAHKFLVKNDMRKFSLPDYGNKASLFETKDKVENWLAKLSSWIKKSEDLSLIELVEQLGANLLPSNPEIAHTLLELLAAKKEKSPDLELGGFLAFLDRLENYRETVPIRTLGDEKGVKILTLHGAKGLEFDYVWIAHMDQKSLTGGKKQAFVLPETVQEKIEKKDVEVTKRELYVALTRAKRFVTISYTPPLADIVAELPKGLLVEEKIDVEKEIKGTNSSHLEALKKLAAEEYTKRNVSVSLLNNFFECGWKWYFQNILRMPQPSAETLEFGSAVHSAIDKILKSKKTFSVKELLEIAGGDKEVHKIISRWVKDRLPQIELERENEKSVSFKDKNFPYLNIYGKIDLIEKLEPNNFRVTDFKTGSVRKKSEIEKLDEEGRMGGSLRQLAMYSYLIQNSYGKNVTVKESLLEFLEAKNSKESFYNREITAADINLLMQDIRDYDNLVKTGEWMSRTCNYNSYGKNTDCVHCKMAEVYKL